MDNPGKPLREEVKFYLAEGYLIWKSTGLPKLPASERYAASDTLLSVYTGENAASLAAACQCFWLFRKLHRMVNEHHVLATLLGDYFFSIFSRNLIPVDSVKLNDEFASLLAKDTQTPIETDGYFDFIRNIPMVLKS